MSSFRDFLFDRDRSAAFRLALAMTGVRMGERQLLVGDDTALFTQLAAKVGLTGTSSVVVAGQDVAARVEAAAAAAGVLVEDLQVTRFPALPVGDALFDVAVLNVGPTFLGLEPAVRQALVGEIRRTLRPAGRLIVVEGEAKRFFGLVGAQPPGLAKFKAANQAARLLEDAGFRPVRVLTEREGQRFTEGLNTAAGTGQGGS
jgi:SAM-dependent methyltransferase